MSSCQSRSKRASTARWAAGARLSHAEQAYHVRSVGVEAQRPVGQSAGVGGKEGRTLLVLGFAIGATDMRTLIADGAHHLAAAVLEHWRAKMRAEAEVHAAQVVLVVLVDREAAQFHDAAAVLQLIGDVGEQAVE